MQSIGKQYSEDCDVHTMVMLMDASFSVRLLFNHHPYRFHLFVASAG